MPTVRGEKNVKPTRKDKRDGVECERWRKHIDQRAQFGGQPNVVLCEALSVKQKNDRGRTASYNQKADDDSEGKNGQGARGRCLLESNVRELTQKQEMVEGE